MQFLVKVRVDVGRLQEFGAKLQRNELDRSLVRSETYCLEADPAVGYSVWEAASADEFEKVFSAWRSYYAEVDVHPVIGPGEALRQLTTRG